MDDEELELKLVEKQEEYKNYIIEHINNVRRAFNEFGSYLCDILGADEEVLAQLVELHDQSKLEDFEFLSYQQYFYPVNEENKKDENVKKAFDAGWCLHKNKNPHHPEFWCNIENHKIIYLDMPVQYIAEMLLDWQAMAYKFGGTAYEYYRKEGDKKPFSNYTRLAVEEAIEIFK
jgi:hypothetical protein